MNKALRTTVSLVVSVVLLSALTMAEAGGKKVDRHKNKQHHSVFAKLAFWRHHKNNGKKAAKQSASKHPQTAGMRAASGKGASAANKTKSQATTADDITIIGP